MDAIGKVTASIASATQETTLALANANFDMSLIRIEAPAEYKPLGMALAKSKRNVAEDGPAHVTARRLGSLFHSILPETPNLIRAYGTRASEIAQSPIVNPKGTDSHGAFKDYVGVDGTSIWAAATSGSAAIAAHLLACIIATCWNADEATAIWVELVAERKHRIQTKAATAEYFDLSETLSSKLELDKGQLASWDASARSWIRAANDSPVVAGRQKTVRSILDHINTTVHNKQDLYTSVTEAWKLSLETMEKIITGSSYSIEDGAVVVALVSWHLYPDLVVLGSQAEDKFQNDELVEPGGCVTVGLRSHNLSLAEKTGVHWSLSLAHLRYYGSLKTTSRSLKNTPSGNGRFTREEFTLVLIGVIIARWRSETDVSEDDAVSFIRLVISKLIELFLDEHPEQLGSWTKAFTAALDDYEAADLEVRGLARKFVNLGLRNESLFHLSNNGVDRTQYSLFGLSSVWFGKALKIKDDQQRFFIAAMKTLAGKSSGRHRPARKLLILLEINVENGPKKLFIFTKSELKGVDTTDSAQNSIVRSELGGYCIPNVSDSVKYVKNDGEYMWSNPPKSFQRYMKRHYSQHGATSAAGEQATFRFRKVVATSHFVLLETFDEARVRELNWTPVKTHGEIKDYLCHAQLAKYEILNLIGRQLISRPLRLLSRLWDFYESLPGATISPNILDCSLHSLSSHLDPPRYDLPQTRSILPSRVVAKLLRLRLLSHVSDRGCAFKLLVTFDAGVDIQTALFSNPSPFSWRHLIAISTDDSIYINPTSLGNITPSNTASLELHRVRGNVGRPGVNLIGWFNLALGTEWRQPRMDMWRVVNHNPFQGNVEDVFSSTSLHLNITGWSREIDFRGNKCVPDGALMEAVASAHDKGTWLGDLSLLFLDYSQISVIRGRRGCRNDTPVIGTMPPEELVVVENWEELLTPHRSQPAVVMCHGNWQARITAASLCAKKRYRTLLFDGHGCWQCAFSHLRLMKLREVKNRNRTRRARPASDADDSVSDTFTSSSESSEEEEKEEASVPGFRSNMSITHQQTATVEPVNNENRKRPEKGDGAETLVGKEDSRNSLANSLARLRIDVRFVEPEQDSDSDSVTASDFDSDIDEELDEKLEEELENLPFVPTVFIL